MIKRVRSVAQKSTILLKSEGLARFSKRATVFAYHQAFPHTKKKYYKDILIIDGCTLPHPSRYRVSHQIEQLKAGGLSAESVFYDRLNIDMLKYYRGFIFFRCPVTETVKDFIAQAKHYNKACFFDIDDLVIDQQYTDTIKFVQSMSESDKALYDDGVTRMRETLELCDYAITPTDTLQQELTKYIKDVSVNRNVASDEMVHYSLDALSTASRSPDKVVIGYFSGSITHNEDFDLVLPSIQRILGENKNVELKIAGILDIPPELMPYKGRVHTVGFVDWRTLPKEIASCDINLAPLTTSIFNEAKSENKWIEAALVKVVTAASDKGAFGTVIKNGKTGTLIADDEWYDKLSILISDKDMRTRIGLAAHNDVIEYHTTINTSYNLCNIVRERLTRNIAFVLPSTDISGGVNVALKHADILRRNGWDVTLIDAIEKSSLKRAQKQYDYRLELPGYNVITGCKTKTRAYFDTMVATLWSTVKDIKDYSNTSNRLYLVQNLETDFYPWGATAPKIMANATYNDTTGLRYVTISIWCKKWLKDRFGKDSRYASNGIDLVDYPYRERHFGGKIHILIEGDSRSEYKNTDEAFRIVEKLDPKKYEVSYLSYRREPKAWYRVDHFYSRIAPEEVGKVYAKCDILIKTSLLESFSYPPLEMMATGGVSVVVPNDGNVEYLRDGVNCLFYEQGNIDDGIAKVELLVNDIKLRASLVKNGLDTARKYQWSAMEDDIVGLYK